MFEARFKDLTLKENVKVFLLPAVVDDVFDSVHSIVADGVIRQIEFLELFSSI